MAERIGIVGGGQLGRMLTQAARPMGLEVLVVDPSDNCPAAQVGAEQIQAPLNDPDALRRLVRSSDITTFEIEHFDPKPLAEMADTGRRIEPHPRTVACIQDKLRQKERLRARGVPIAEFLPVESADAFDHAQTELGPVIVKARKGGYDGRGNLVVGDGQSWSDVVTFFDGSQGGLYAEKIVPFQRELSVVAARNTVGQIALYPTVETIHKDNICHIVRAPAQRLERKTERQTQEVAHETLGAFDGAGVFAVEMFLTEDGEVLVNEVAPRVHNSGHWTIEGSETSQFRQHLLAITGQKLGSTAMTAPAAVMVNILGRLETPNWRRHCAPTLSTLQGEGEPNTYVHWYGKLPRLGRKLGHITALGSTIKRAERTARHVRSRLIV